MKIKPLFLLFTFVLLLAFSVPGSASPMFGLTFQNVTFTITQVDSNTLTLRMQNALNANGDWAGVSKIDHFQFGDIGSLGGATVSGSGTWTYLNQELNSSGCGAGSVSSAKHCFTASSPVALSNDMTWTIDYASGSFAFATNGSHLKVRFLDAGGSKQGSLLSQNLPGVQQVPEPATGVLLLSGLALMRFIARRRT